MIYFCSEIWRYGGLIAGVGHPSSVELYKVLGNKRVRVGRIIEWERKHDQTYPRLDFHITTQFKAMKKDLWVKADFQDHLIPYKCSNVKKLYDNLRKINV